MIKALFIVFILFALSRAFLRYRDRSLSIQGLLAWSLIWVMAAVIIIWPGLTSLFAVKLGIGRGTDAIVYTSIILIFYLIFRLYIKISAVDQEITRLIRALALEKNKK
jgi:small membrane protein